MNISRLTPMAVVLAGFLAATPLASAQEKAAGEQDAPSKAAEGRMSQQGGGGSGELAQTQQKLRKLGRELQSVRKQAMAENSELQSREQSLREDVMAHMREQGVDPQEAMSRMQEIQQQRRSGDMEAAKKQELAKEFRETMRSVREARRSAMQDEQIMAKREAFRKDLMAAMKAQDAQVEEKLAEYRETQRELRQKMRQSGASGG